MGSKKQYTFYEVLNCNMCGADKEQFKVMGKRLNKRQGFAPNKSNGITVSVCKCSVCHTIFSNPQPQPESFQDHYGIPPESYWKEDYFSVSPDYFKSEIDWFKQLVDFQPGMKSLDIGAGIGKQMTALTCAKFDAYGIEPSEDFYNRAISKMGIPENKITLSTIENAEYEQESFDFISFSAVAEYIYDPSYCIKKALGWLKKDGLIHVEVPSSNWLISKLLNMSYAVRGLDYVTNLSPMHTPYHLFEFTPKSFTLNGEKLAYTVVDYKYYICQTFMPKFLNPFLRRYMKWTNTGMQLCVWLKKT